MKRNKGNKYPVSPELYYADAAEFGLMRRNRHLIGLAKNVVEYQPFIQEHVMQNYDDIELSNLTLFWARHGYIKV